MPSAGAAASAAGDGCAAELAAGADADGMKTDSTLWAMSPASLRWTFDISLAGGKGGTWYFWGRVLNPNNRSDYLLIKDDPQKVLPTLVMTQMPFIMQVLFFGALLSAIKSCASATLLAPSVTFTENIWRQFRPHQSDKQELRAMRVTCVKMRSGRQPSRISQ